MKNGKEHSSRIGVALSGGGVRGLSHLGILQVLEEAEVPIDFLAGTSMGGLVAGLYAAGVPLVKLIAVSEERLSRYPPDVLLEVCLPNVGVMTSDDNAAIIAAGRQVALEHREKLVALRDEPLSPQWQRWIRHW